MPMISGMRSGHGALAPVLPEAHAQNAVVMEALAAAAHAYARGGYFVVVDGIIGPWFLAPFGRKGAAVHYVVLPAFAGRGDPALWRARRR
jgi:hypothetical protein